MKAHRIKIILGLLAVIAFLCVMPRGMRYWQPESKRCAVTSLDDGAWNYVGCDKRYVNPDKMRDVLAGEAKDLRADAEKGDAEAQYKLGVLLHGADDTQHEGADWLMKAAKQGYVPAESEIGRVYESGEPGYAKDEEESYYWFSLAYKGGEKEAGEEADKITSWLTPEQIEAANKRVKETTGKP
jgi:hypothetical protein